MVFQVDRPKSNNILLTGLPRSGTTLVCHLLNKLSDAVALNEPIQVSRFPYLGSHESICDEIEQYFATTRASIHNVGKVISTHVDGEVPDNSFTDKSVDSGLRRSTLRRGEISIDKPLREDFLLFVKHTAAFTAILEHLVLRFPVFAIIRNPLATLTSWNTVNVPIHLGHIPAAEDLDEELADALRVRDDVVERQLYVLAWFFGKYSQLLPERAVVRYEDIIETGGSALAIAAHAAGNLRENLKSKNRNEIYSRERMRMLAMRLLKSEGEYWKYYSKDSVKKLL